MVPVVLRSGTTFEPDPVVASPGYVYRSQNAVINAAGATLILFGCVAMAAVRGPFQVLGLALAAPALVIAVRAWQLGVRVSGRGVTVVSWLRSWQVGWSEIQRFETRGGSFYAAVAVLIRHDARTIPIVALSLSRLAAGSPDRVTEQVERPVGELNRLLAQRRCST